MQIPKTPNQISNTLIPMTWDLTPNIDFKFFDTSFWTLATWVWRALLQVQLMLGVPRVHMVCPVQADLDTLHV